MEGYILIVLQILITGLIIWRRKQDSKEPSGCLAAGVNAINAYIVKGRRCYFHDCICSDHRTVQSGASYHQ